MNHELRKCIIELRKIQETMRTEFGLEDIYSNSKIYEIMIANELGHRPIAGHSGTRNGKTVDGEFEYKHYKESSSNHSWTFNDYSDNVIEKLKDAKSVIFAHIDDSNVNCPMFDWYIEVNGSQCSSYLKYRTEALLERKPKGKVNNRRMINFSPKQLEDDLKISKTYVKHIGTKGKFTRYLSAINEISGKIESITKIGQIQTSNKLWELLTAIPLEHQVLTEQAGHDAKDNYGNLYEYKVAKNTSWNFQDISEKVLIKYRGDKSIILSTVNKERLEVTKIFIADSNKVVVLLKMKLNEKKIKYEKNGKELRRLAVSISKGDLAKVNAVEFPLHIS
ncbi:MAG: hypothetical protein K8823_910 [Cenarchaeum symbiont of Oopsacas minuta]|nr:hypothetical protein [Cenarchaeum symbiont of Oopsacas minuta]